MSDTTQQKPVAVLPLGETHIVVTFEAQAEDVDMKRHFRVDCGWTPAQIRGLVKFDWFCAKVSIWKDGVCLADEYLGCCSYKQADEFWSTYKGDYFADMVLECINTAHEAGSFTLEESVILSDIARAWRVKMEDAA